MRKLVLCAIFVLLTMLTSVCSAFEIDRNQWFSYATVNNIECYYNERSVQKDGNIAKVWLCYHYKIFDTYRLILKEYTRDSNKAKILKILDYYSDGTLKRASNKVVPDVSLGTNEDIIKQRIW